MVNDSTGIVEKSFVKGGGTYNVENYPLLWINGLYYNTYKADTFVATGADCIFAGYESDYDAVTIIDLGNKSLTTDFDFLYKFLNVQIIEVDSNSITVFDISSNSSITSIDIRNNQIIDLDLANKVNLQVLTISNNLISSLNITNSPLLTSIEAFTNQLTSLDTSNNPLLITLNIYGNLITSFNLSNNTLLKNIAISSNLLTSLNISNNTLLEVLQMTSIPLVTSLDISNNPLLRQLRIQGCQIVNLDISNNPLLVDLICFLNKLSNITHSQLLIDFDGHNLSNGYFYSTIFGGGALTTAGLAAKASLLAKGWTIIGL